MEVTQNELMVKINQILILVWTLFKTPVLNIVYLL